MTTLTTIFLMLLTFNVFAFSKKVEAEFNESGSTICSDRSIGKGNTDEPVSIEEPTDSSAIQN